VRMPPARSLTVSVLACSVMAATIALVLGVIGTLAFADAIQLTVGAATLGVLAVVLIGQRRVDGKVQRLIRSHRKHAELDIESILGGRFDELDSQVNNVIAALGEDRVMALTHEKAISSRLFLLEKLEKDVESLADTVTDGDAASQAALDRLYQEVLAVSPRLDELTGKVDALRPAGEVQYRQLEAYLDLRGLIRPRAPMPALRGWAASPDVTRFLAETMIRHRPKLTVECGSGASSVWLGYVAELLGSARVVALENDERFAEISRDLIRAHGLDDIVEIRLAPLADWHAGDDIYHWYGIEALDDLVDIGLVFVDGPAGLIAPHVRYPAMPLLLPRCADDMVLVLDDANRGEEIAISDQWLAENPELERDVIRFEKGAHVFRRRTQ
jgi:predicted O-methyltransferase YrrM